jgi:glucose/mannose-6-phosphate isomerase
MLDDQAVIIGKDPHGVLQAAAIQPAQATWSAQLHNQIADTPLIETVVFAGISASGLAGKLAQSWLRLKVPFEVVSSYDVPRYVNQKSLVIASSYSGNTEETLGALEAAETAKAQIVVIASGGQLIDHAQEKNYPFVQLPAHYQSQMTVLLELRAILMIYEAYNLVSKKYAEIAAISDWLNEQVQSWLPAVPLIENQAKQLASHAVGKTVIIYSGPRMAPIGYKWKTSFNEYAKNLAFSSILPEANYNDMPGWTSHPVDKPFAVFDLISGFEHPQILKSFALTDRLLSGLRPKSVPIELQGESVIAQMLWGCVLADFVGIYLAILNGVDPSQADIIEKFKRELE